MENIKLKSAWQAESIRLIESSKGFYSDDVQLQKIAASQTSFVQKLLQRSAYLAELNGIGELISAITKNLKIVLFGIVFMALLFASLSTKASIGSNQASVNIFAVLATLLGVHLLTFILWLFSYLFGNKDQSHGFGSLWIWLSGKVNTKSNAHLVSQALFTTLSRQNAFKPLLGCVTNGMWLVMLLSAWFTLLAMFSTKSYTFHWETTILSPQVFINITYCLAWLPELFGFNAPDASLIKLSGIDNQQSTQAAALWSQWLIAVVLFYGIAIRLMAFVVMFAIYKKRIKTLKIDTSLNGYTELHTKLMPNVGAQIVDAPAPEYIIGKAAKHKINTDVVGANALIAIEMPHIDKWPPFKVPDSIIDIGIVDSSEQRKQAFKTLMHASPGKLLIIVDAKQTPDRGSIRLILELIQLSQQSKVLLLESVDNFSDQQSRKDVWISYLQKAGIQDHKIYNDVDLAQQWLKE